MWCSTSFIFNDTATTEIYTLSLHDALPIFAQILAEQRRRALPGAYRQARATPVVRVPRRNQRRTPNASRDTSRRASDRRSEEHTSELQSRQYLVCRLLLEKKIRAPPSSRSL